MKYDVTFTEQAENDLRGIFEYIAFYNHKSYEAYETFGFIRLFFFTFLS